MLNFELGYRFNTYHEAGISIGQNDGSQKKYLRTEINGTDTIDIFSSKLQRISFSWFGIYYKYHLGDYFYAGIKIGHSPEEGTYHEFSIGKDFEAAKNLFIRLNVGACIRTINLFDFNEDIGYDDNLGITLGVNYHF